MGYLINEEMTFTGKTNGVYRFKKDEDTIVNFKKLRIDLIHEFLLDEEDHIGRLFKTRYFLSTHAGIDVPILSDLELID